MPFGFISGTLAAILLIIGILALFSKRVRSMLSIVRRLPLIGALSVGFIAILLIGVGLYAGGFGVIKSWLPISTATITTTEVSRLPTATLSYCEYKEAVAPTTNTTIRTDSTYNNLVWLDIADIWHNATSVKGDYENATNQTTTIDEASGQYEAIINITCVRAGDIQEDASIEMVATSEYFLSELDTSSASEYSILEQKTQASNVWEGQYQQEVYLTTDGASSSSSSDIERAYLTFSEGEKEKTLTITVELDNDAFDELENYTTKSIHIYSRNGGDTERFTIKVQKVKESVNGTIIS